MFGSWGNRHGLGAGQVSHDSTEQKETVLIGRPQLVQALQ